MNSSRARARRRGPKGDRAAHPPARRTVALSPRAVPFIVFAAALLWRGLYLFRLHGTLLFGSRAADSGVYWDWSAHILRNGLSPPGPFFLAPLYPYVLAAERLLLGNGPVGVLAFQAILGAIAIALLSSAATTLTRPAIGLALGLVLGGFRGATFFDGLLLPESLLFALESLLVWLVARTAWTSSSRAHVAYGLIVGGIAQGRAVALPLIALLPVLALASGLPMRAAWRRSLIGIAACVLTTIPTVLANHGTAREFIPFTYSAGLNLYVGNNPQATGTYVDVLDGDPVVLPPASALTGGALDGRDHLRRADGTALSPAASSSAWTRRAMEFVRAQPVQALRTTGRKLLLLLNDREVPQVENMDAFDAEAGPLGLPLVGRFGFVAMLGLLGVAVAVRGGARERWMAAYVAILLLATLPFFVTDRYRHHLVPGLAILAALALDRIARVVRERSVGSVTRWAGGLACAAVVVWLPIGGAATNDWGLAVDRGLRLAAAGKSAEAVGEFRHAEQMLRNKQISRLSPTARTEAAEFYAAYASALEATGDVHGAIELLERATRLRPGQVEWLGRLERLLAGTGMADRSTAVREQLQKAPGGKSRMLVNQARQAAAQGDWATARDRFRRALALDSRQPQAWEGLLRVEIQNNQLDAATQVLSEARRNGLDDAVGDVYESFLLMSRGEKAAARRMAESIDPSGITDPDLRMLRDLTLERTR